MRGNLARLGITGARSSASRSSKAKAAFASTKNAAMASRRSRKLAVSSTRQASSATLPGSLAGGGSGSALLNSGEGSIRRVGTACLDVGQSTLGIVNQQQMDALAFQPVVVVQPVCVDESDIALAVLGDDLF